jgi:hypothetical protein
LPGEPAKPAKERHDRSQSQSAPSSAAIPKTEPPLWPMKLVSPQAPEALDEIRIAADDQRLEAGHHRVEQHEALAVQGEEQRFADDPGIGLEKDEQTPRRGDVMDRGADRTARMRSLVTFMAIVPSVDERARVVSRFGAKLII